MSRQPVISQSVSHGSLGNHQLHYLNAHGKSVIESITSNANGGSNRNSLVRSGLAVQDPSKGGMGSLKQGTVASGAQTTKKKSKSKSKGASQRDNQKPKLLESV
jgi:hypothetical protein